MTLFSSIILISFYQIILIHGQDLDSSSVNDDPPGNDDTLPINSISDNGLIDRLSNNLDGIFPGDTFHYPDLSNLITDEKIDNDQCEVKFNSDIRSLLGSKLLVGTVINTNQILAVTLTFHNKNGDLVRADDGQPIRYSSNRQDFGHILNILHQGFAFSYAKCLFRLQPNSNFDLNNIFFHFSHLSSGLLTNNDTAIIIGPTSALVNSIAQMYNVSINCPLSLTCMWLLDDAVIYSMPNTSVMLTFEQKHIGNRTLSYVAYIRNNPQTLASLLLSISSTRRLDCLQLPRYPSNTWLSAGTMSSPRVYFTATYLPNSRSVMVVGGTADGSNPLSSVEIYDLYTGCYNVTNMTYARMQHTAAYFNSSDIVLAIGGLGSGGTAVQPSELISAGGGQVYQSMSQARFQHAMAKFNLSTILIVAGRGFHDNSKQIERYNRASFTFETLQLFHPELNNLEGHSVTALGETGSVLIFGGYNGNAYSGTGFIYDGNNLTIVGSQDLDLPNGSPPARAYHQATYIPSMNAVLITGGDNGNETLSDCHLYYLDSQTFNITTPLRYARSFHRAVLVGSNAVLIIGGATEMENNQPKIPTNSVERYDPVANTTTRIASLNVPSYSHEVVSVFNDEVFIFGGFDYTRKVLARIEFMMIDV